MVTRKSFLSAMGTGVLGVLAGYETGSRSRRTAATAVGDGGVVDLPLPAGYTVGSDPIDRFLADGVERARELGAPLRIPPGTHLFEQAQVWEDLPGLAAAGILRPSSALNGATCVTISTVPDHSGLPPESVITGLRMDGSLTEGAQGLVLGGNSVSARIHLDHVRVESFQGRGAVGLRVADVVQPVIANSRFTRCETNCLIDGTDPALPTMTSFQDCYFNYASRQAVRVAHGYTIRFDRCVFEGNGEEGTWLEPGLRENVLDAVFEDCWWEANHRGRSSSAATYHFVAIGSAAGATCEPRLIRPFFSGGARSVRLVQVSSALLDAPRVPNVRSTIRIEHPLSTGSVRNWNVNIGVQSELIANDSAHIRGISNSGAIRLAAGAKSARVQHGLGVSPSVSAIRVTPLSTLGSASHWWIGAVSNASFDILLDAAPGGSGVVFSWAVEL